MDIFPNKFYQPTEDEVQLEELKAKIIKNKEYKDIIRSTELDISKVRFNPFSLDNES